MAEIYDQDDEPTGINALDILKAAVREEAQFALWEVDYQQWPWQWYEECGQLGD